MKGKVLVAIFGCLIWWFLLMVHCGYTFYRAHAMISPRRLRVRWLKKNASKEVTCKWVNRTLRRQVVVVVAWLVDCRQSRDSFSNLRISWARIRRTGRRHQQGIIILWNLRRNKRSSREAEVWVGPRQTWSRPSLSHKIWRVRVPQLPPPCCTRVGQAAEAEVERVSSAGIPAAWIRIGGMIATDRKAAACPAGTLPPARDRVLAEEVEV